MQELIDKLTRLNKLQDEMLAVKDERIKYLEEYCAMQDEMIETLREQIRLLEEMK